MLEARGLYKDFSVGTARVQVLKNITVRIERGEAIGIVGPSGAGKSTLLHLLGGLDTPTQGTVTFMQDDLSRVDERKRASIRNRFFGFVFQFYHLLAEFSALENVMLPALIAGRENKKAVRERASQLLGQCGLGSRLHHRPAQLSGGEQQRVAIARALVNTPQVVFCDEPTGNLDTESGEAIKRLLWQFHAEHKTTLVVVTHQRSLVEDADRMVRLQDGIILGKEAA